MWKPDSRKPTRWVGHLASHHTVTMKQQPFKNRAERAIEASRSGGDGNVGRGMELALTIGGFLIVGVLLDHWLGTSPIFTIVLLVLAAVGSFTSMKYSYDASMERHEAERRQRIESRRAPVTPDDVTVEGST